MLVPKQWGRIVGGVVAVVVFLVLLKGLHEYPPYRESIQAPSIKFAVSGPEVATSQEPILAEPTGQPPVTILPSALSIPISTSSLAAQYASSPVETAEARPTNFGLPDWPSQQKPTSIANATSTDSSSAKNTTVSRKAVVMGRTMSEDTDWVGQELADWERAIYVVDLPEDMDSPTGLKTKINKANEVTPYLTYIIDNYADLPDIAVFLHAHRSGWPKAWHNDAPDYDAVRMLRGLHLAVVQQRGFVNLRCMGTPGCPNEIQLNRFPVDEEKTAEIAYPFVYGEFFNMTVEDVRQQVPVIATPCCAQFAVSRAQVLQWPKLQYERWLGLIEESDVESHTLGTVLEYMWHIIFGQDAVHCEQEQVCRAALYDYGNPGDWR